MSMALIKCSECGKEVSDSASSCPNCGFPVNKEVSNSANNSVKNDLKSKKKPGCLQGCLISISVLAAICIAGFVFIAVNGQKVWDASVSMVADSSDQKKDDLEVLSYDSITEGGLGYVTGEIKNNTEKNYTYVQVEINMYKDETVLGSTLANVNNLGPGETWKFKALITDKECNRYTIKEVTGF